jgi:hypothetical protein
MLRTSSLQTTLKRPAFDLHHYKDLSSEKSIYEVKSTKAHIIECKQIGIGSKDPGSEQDVSRLFQQASVLANQLGGPQMRREPAISR